MFYTIILHLLAGTVAGSVFRVGTLLLLVGLIVVEPVILAVLQSSTPVYLVIIDLAVVQVGYLVGIISRGVLPRGRPSSVQSHDALLD